ncbi:MAG: DsbA family protein [Pseudomonadota bacterium]|nr:DsbA family protein [Pseudomonadota bacterium]
MSFRSLKSWLMPVISQRFLSRERLLALRQKAEQKRQRQSRPHVLHFFHQVDDPYSQLLAQAIPLLKSRYAVSVLQHVVGEPDDSAVPERDKLKAYSLLDAARLASQYGLRWPEHSEHNNVPKPTAESLQTSHRLRKSWGHYLSGMIYYEGEWYWGIDRLHHLESRLTDLGLATHIRSHRQQHPATLFETPQYQAMPNVPEGTSIDFYFSFRSPYSAISVAKVFDWAKANGVEVNVKYVLPMVMRGLPVPAEKRKYISLDAAREAHVQNVPFGRLNDPVGKPTERGLALIPFAQMHQLAEPYIKSFMQGVWAEGLDAGTDAHLKIIVERAGLNWDAAKDILHSKANDTHWRSVAEQNRQALSTLGLWGVPSFRFEDTAVWGQDRFWAIEKAMHAKFDAVNPS